MVIVIDLFPADECVCFIFTKYATAAHSDITSSAKWRNKAHEYLINDGREVGVIHGHGPAIIPATPSCNVRSHISDAWRSALISRRYSQNSRISHWGADIFSMMPSFTDDDLASRVIRLHRFLTNAYHASMASLASLDALALQHIIW